MAARVLLLLLALAGTGQARAEEARVIPALYPEGPLWQGDKLYFAEMRADRITVVDAAGPRAFFEQEGCGPTAIAPYGEGFVVLCHLGARLVAVDATGKELRRWRRARPGLLLGRPNDASADGKGGIYFSRPGIFGLGWAPRGWIMHLSADGVLRPIAGRLDYPNGVHVAGDVLYVSEHLRGRILRYDIEDGGRLGRPRTFVDLAKIPRPARYRSPYPLTGPDGLEIGPDGNLYVALYGEGRLLKFSPGGELLGMMEFPARYLTNVAFGRPGVAVTGAFDNQSQESPGEVRILSAPP
ncbi:MAG TPA: SMP-30/gluconolactonase/LRE family protein [Steroidobacteraceae bacterium]|nr:SMP-30/gluconolactonase/LRE family protein [Steroidobacteraceae bacterium]